MNIILFYIIIFAILLGLEFVYFRIADKFNIIDQPNDRSSHQAITLRGGGIIFYVSIIIFFIISNLTYPYFFVGLTMISLISFADDLKPQSRLVRLLVHLTAIVLLFVQWNCIQWQWYYILFALVFCAGIINAYNFMDGINGITGFYSIVMLSALWYVNNFVTVNFVQNSLIYCLMLSIAVFGIFNFRKNAKCFAGDIGSISMAFILIFLLGLLIVKTHNISYIMLLSIYGVDAILTIIHRIILKENIFKPHRLHIYQMLTNEKKIPHLLVSTIYAVLQSIIIFGLLFFSNYALIYSVIVIILLSITYYILIKIMWRM
ncbi:MAG: UDP-GlcNAc--UDP-phosphate GlcNAc-1-phosphate transferase [Paludibacter sp.]|nr:UDP-GlcNAc--UDP-phosphate GlcNAc-1-phosphate transferase [Paludibacter sp.]